MSLNDQHKGVTLVELVIMIVVIGIMCVTTPPLLFRGVKTLVFLPKALAANQVATEVIHQMVEGGFSTLSGQTTVRGLRFAVHSGSQQAVWDAQPNEVGFRTSDNQCVVIQLTGGLIQRRVAPVAPTASCVVAVVLGTPPETIPYDASGVVTILATSPVLFQYNTQSGLIRRVDITFVAQTGNGDFNQGNAQEQVTSSVAIRFP